MRKPPISSLALLARPPVESHRVQSPCFLLHCGQCWGNCALLQTEWVPCATHKRIGCRKNLLANLKRLNPEVLKCNYKVVSAIKPKPSFSQLIFLCSHSSKPKPSFLQLIFCVLSHPSRNLHSYSSSFCVLSHPSRNLHSYSSSFCVFIHPSRNLHSYSSSGVFSLQKHTCRLTPRVFTYSPLYIHIF